MGKKDAALHGLTKKERKALKRQEAALVAELNERASKPVKPKKAKAETALDLTELKRKALKALIADKTNGPLRKAAKAELVRRESESLPPVKGVKATPKSEGNTEVKPKRATPKAAVTEAAERVLVEAGTPEAKAAAETALEAATEAGDDETDAQIKARVRAKRELRAHEATAADIDRDDAAAVKAYNDRALELGGGRFITSNAELAKEAERLGDEAPLSKTKAAKPAPEPIADEVEDAERATLDEAKSKTAKAPHVVEPVETEEGTVYEAGTAKVDPAEARGFALPSEAPQGPPDFEVNGNGQYKIKRLSDGKIVGYTRATTYIGTNEDRTLLERWKLRILLEGVAVNDAPDDNGRSDDPVVARVRDLIHVRDVTLAKARKDDRKGKLVPGKYGTIVDAAWSQFKRDLDTLAENLLELGGVHVKAAKGTELHELTELYDREGIDAVGELLLQGKITHADLADIEAYGRALEAAGIKILMIEQPIVVEDLKVAGRLDRVVMAKLPGAGRAAKYILDTKSGRIDLGGGKIAQQLELYSRGETYNLETHERGTHGASRTKALVLHLVPGSGEAKIYVVDLGTGRVGNDLSGKVRAFRNDGKRAIDMTVDLAAGS
jgi:hypothetical protein